MTGTLGDWADSIVGLVPELAGIKPAVENELLAMAVFDALNRRSLLAPDAVFIGGTALRLCHGSPRFSEDLDFHAPEPVSRALDRRTLAEEVAAVIGCDVDVSVPTAKGRSTLARVSAILPDRTRDKRRPRTKIDLGEGAQLDARPTVVTLRMAGGLLPGMGDVGDMFSFMASSTEELLVNKHMALVGRAKRIKQRDVFDLLWLHGQSVTFRPDLLAAKLPEKEKGDFADTLRQRAAAAKEGMLNGDYQAELERFLPAGSSWLFNDDKRREGMAGGFETLMLDHAKAAEREITRTAAPVQPRKA